MKLFSVFFCLFAFAAGLFAAPPVNEDSWALAAQGDDLALSLALPANAQNVNLAKQKAGSAAHKKAQEADEAKLLASQLAKAEVTIPVKVGEGGKLFGSVTGKDVAEALKKAHGVDIDKRKISLPQDLTGVGDYEAVIKLHPEATAKVTVHITEG